jgi:3-oxoacyl-(acyl-carrier-protein) synthase
MFITRRCTVDGRGILLGGTTVFARETADPAEFLKSAYRGLAIQYPKFFKMDLLSKLGFLATEVLLKHAGLAARYEPDRIGILLLNSSSSLDTDEKHQDSISDPANYFPSPSVFVYTLPNIMIGEIAIRQRIKGENTVIITDIRDAATLRELVEEWFEYKRVDCCIAGYVEAYRDRLSASVVVVERDELAKSVAEPEENIIFDGSNFERILNEAL